jgi:hypothetical protein
MRLVVMAAVPTSGTEKISPMLIRVLVLLGLSVFVNYIDGANLICCGAAAEERTRSLCLAASFIGPS